VGQPDTAVVVAVDPAKIQQHFQDCRCRIADRNAEFRQVARQEQRVLDLFLLQQENGGPPLETHEKVKQREIEMKRGDGSTHIVRRYREGVGTPVDKCQGVPVGNLDPLGHSGGPGRVEDHRQVIAKTGGGLFRPVADEERHPELVQLADITGTRQPVRQGLRKFALDKNRARTAVSQDISDALHGAVYIHGDIGRPRTQRGKDGRHTVGTLVQADSHPVAPADGCLLQLFLQKPHPP